LLPDLDLKAGTDFGEFALIEVIATGGTWIYTESLGGLTPTGTA
jgi:hypothetical protein